MLDKKHYKSCWKFSITMDSKKYIGHYHELFFVVKQNISKVLDKNYLKDGRMEAGKE